MPAAALRTANDNRPAAPPPAPVAPPELVAAPVGTAPRRAPRLAPHLASWLHLLLGWAFLSAALFALAPHTAWLATAAAGLLAAAGFATRSRFLTALAGALAPATPLLLWQDGSTAALPSALLSATALALLALAHATKLRSPFAATVVVLATLLAAALAIGSSDTALASLAPIAGALALLLGLARLAVNRGHTALEPAYLTLWLLLAIAALALQLAPPAPLPDVPALAGALLFAAATAAWGANRIPAAFSVAAIACAFLLASRPALSAALGLDPALLPPAVAGAVAAAGLALCARGLARASTPAMLLGIATAMLQLAVLLHPDTPTTEQTVAFLASLLLSALWLFALRFR